MHTNDLAEWIQSEHVAVEKLMSSVRELAVDPPPENRAAWIAQMRERFERLRAHLIKHMAMEEDGGYLAPVIELRPNLSAEVQRLGHEHDQMIRLLELIHRALKSATDRDELIVRDCCRRIRDFLACAENHEQQENLLIASVFNLDIGPHD